MRLRLGPGFNAAELVFPGEDGEPWWSSNFARACRRVFDDAGLFRIRLHDLRHTHATMLLRAGVHPKVVSERLGHSSISLTLDVYSHVMPGMQREAAERIDESLRAALPGSGRQIRREVHASTQDTEATEAARRPRFRRFGRISAAVDRLWTTPPT